MPNDKQWNMLSSVEKALLLARRQLSELVWDAVNLEGINFTLPEVQTLLDGVTIGGHKISDQQIALNQAKAWQTVFNWVEQGAFVVSLEKILQLHAVAGKDEALEWGQFRKGSVTIAGTQYMPPEAATLPALFEQMVMDAGQRGDIYDQAIHYFLTMARTQFFYDVNKRMGRFVMNGVLLQNGYPAINLPARRQLEFNTLMLQYYDSGEPEPMNVFLRSCLDERLIAIMKERKG